jgi:hypothetical protein
VNVDKLIVVVQINGPIESNGSLGVFGKTATVGSVSPRDVSVVINWIELVDAVDKDKPDANVTCLATGPEEVDDVVVVLEVRAEGMLDEKLSVVVDEGTAFGIDDGIETGQKLHTPLFWSQYRSISNLR